MTYLIITYTVVSSACESENVGAVTLGYTKLSWDNESGQERKPLASFKSWAQLTANEKAGALLLGYTQSTWDDVSGSETPPASTDKSWDELTVCDEGTAGAGCCWPSATHIYCMCSGLFAAVYYMFGGGVAVDSRSWRLRLFECHNISGGTPLLLHVSY